MKTSFTKTFNSIANGKKPCDEVFSRKTICETMKDDTEISRDDIFVINSYEDEYISPNSAKLMVNKELRERYDAAINKIATSREVLFARISEILHNDGEIISFLKDALNCDDIDVLEYLNKEVTSIKSLNSLFGEICVYCPPQGI